MKCACIILHGTIERGSFAIGSRIVSECPCECHAPCALCGAYDGEHDAGCMIAPCPSCGQKECSCGALTPGEMAELRRVAERAERDGADNAPMTLISWDHSGERSTRIMPWLDALNMDPALGY